jgi:hypothetical protein
MDESQLSSIFGSPYESSSQTGYILFYERQEHVTEHVIDTTLFNCAPIIESIEPRPVDIPVNAVNAVNAGSVPVTRLAQSVSLREDYVRTPNSKAS